MKRFITIVLVAATWGFLLAPAANAVIVDVNELRYDTHKWVGISGFSFLKVAQGARPAAMGDAYVAVADDINAIYWNQAGLTAIRGTAWSATYTRWLVNSYLMSAAVAWNTGGAKSGVLAASVVAVRYDDIIETTIYQPTGTGANVAAGDLGIGLVYALKLTDKFSFGARLQWINQTLHTESMSSFSLDVGTQFFTGFRSLRLAMAMRNFGPDKRLEVNKFIMPVYYTIATAMELYGERGDPGYLTMSAETAFAVDYATRAHLGAELWLQNMVALRGGYKVGYNTDSYSLGAGLKYEIAADRALTVDVAYSDMGKYFTAPLRVTVGGTF